MRIEFVTDTFQPDVNGVAMTLGHLTQGMKSMGHYVHVLHTGSKEEPGQTAKFSVSVPGYKEVRVGMPSPIKLRKRWKRKRPDAVYVATESPLGISAIKVARELSIPVVAGFHTNFHQYLSSYNLGSIKKPALGYLKFVHSMADMTMAPSPDAVDLLRSEGFENVELLGRGVDVELFTPRKRSQSLRKEWGAEGDEPILLIVGRLAVEKNLPFTLNHVVALQQRNSKLKCVVVGDGPLMDGLIDKYRSVHFVGVKRGEELARCYASADVLLFASETETFGNVLLEAMASGLTTVSYAYAASAKYVVDGSNGLQAELGNEGVFIQKIARAIECSAEGEMRTNARSSIEGLSWNRVVKDFEKHLTTIISQKPVTQRRLRPVRKLEVRSLFLSDIHLGAANSKAREVVQALKSISCERIYLNGDIIDGWALKRGAKWKKAHTKVLRVLLKKMEKEGTELIYLRGNHDDFLERILPFEIAGLKIVTECVHTSVHGDSYLVVHGDGFDSVSTNHKWVASLGASSYDFLLKVNRIYNGYRVWRGKDYYSLSKVVKSKVKSAVSFVDKYEEKLQELANAKNCQGIICGHIHTPADKKIGGVHYLNSGDWVETLSCILEHKNGDFEVVHYEDLLTRVEVQPSSGSESQDDDDSESEGVESLLAHKFLKGVISR